MFIFEKAPFKSCHASTVVEHEPGRLLAAWFGGDREGAPNVQIWGSAFDGTKWSEPAVVGSEPGQPCFNPVYFKTARCAWTCPRAFHQFEWMQVRWSGYSRICCRTRSSTRRQAHRLVSRRGSPTTASWSCP